MYIRIPLSFLPVFLSWCIKLEFGRSKFELCLKSLSVDHVSVTKIILKYFVQFIRKL